MFNFLINNYKMEEYNVTYSAKDVILYAVSIGFGSIGEYYENDLRFVYEGHPQFQTVETFCLSLVFWAQTQKRTHSTCSDIPPFPPPMMRSTVTIPKKCLRKEVADLDEFPVLHVFQSVSWNAVLPTPSPQEKNVTVKIIGKLISIHPKSIGTFLTTETSIYGQTKEILDHTSRICTMQSTTLVLGLSDDLVTPFSTNSSFPRITWPIQQHEHQRDTLLLETEFPICQNQALLYRLSSGDSNKIHVSASEAFSLSKDKRGTPRDCLLHGLCTLGMVTRIIMQQLQKKAKLSLSYLSGKFVKPVFVNDTLCLKVWKIRNSSEMDWYLAFTVQNKISGVDVLRDGRILVRNRPVVVPVHSNL
jgi:acyl dehydratase